MEVSIIIATFNRRLLLERTLPSLLRQDFPADRYEVIVVVDGSTDGTLDFLRAVAHRGNLRVIEQPNLGQAAAINAGLQKSLGKMLLFLDDDILCGSTLVAEHASAPASAMPSWCMDRFSLRAKAATRLPSIGHALSVTTSSNPRFTNLQKRAGTDAWRRPTLLFRARSQSPSADSIILQSRQ